MMRMASPTTRYGCQQEPVGYEFLPHGGQEEGSNMSNAQKVIKWRAAAPIAKAAASAGTVVALIAVVGAPLKWW